MIKKISLLLLVAFGLSSCGFKTPIHDARNVYRQLKQNNESLTPPEYYGQAQPASFSPEDAGEAGEIHGSKATETDSRDGHEHKTQYILIGTLAGLALVAGIVIPIVLLKK